jgi:pimeloyl-ACP methyl ester carboxylesterase
MRLLYLHGFASSPGSRKGLAFERFMSARGFRVERLDMRLPERERLRVSAMIDATLSAIGEDPRVVLVGSSLGGLVAAQAAVASAAVCAVVLMAPAFGFAERWGASLGEARLARWRAGEALEVEDHAGGPALRIDHGFYEDACAIDVALPELSIPALVFHGVNDDVVPVEGSREFARQRSRVRLVELDDGNALSDSIDEILVESLNFFGRHGCPAR